MARNTSSASRRRDLAYLAVIVAVVWAVFDPLGWLRWVVLAGLTGALSVHLHRTSGAWLEILGQEATSLDDGAIPEDLDGRLRPLLELGFSRPFWWVTEDQVGVTLLSSDGLVGARTAESDAGRGPMFSTDWPNALLLTSRGLGIPMRPDDHIQIMPDVSTQALFEAHQEAVGILSRRYGPPNKHSHWTIETLNEGAQRRRDWLRRHRYRRTATALARWYLNWGYRSRLAQQIGYTTNLLFVWLFLAMTWALVTWFWTSAVSAQSRPLIGAAIFVSLLTGTFSIAALASLRKRRRFRRQVSNDAR